MKKIEIQVKAISEIKQTQAVVLPIYEGAEPTSASKHFDKLANEKITETIKAESFKGKEGKTLYIPSLNQSTCSKALLIGVGKDKELTLTKYRKFIETTARAIKEITAEEITCTIAEVPLKNYTQTQVVRLIAQHILLSQYTFNQFKESANTSPKENDEKQTIIITVDDAHIKPAKQAVNEAQAIVSGMNTTKDLGNLPANICTPTYLADEAKKFADKYAKISTTIIDKEQMEKLGMGSFLSVAQGSEEPPKLIIMEYKGADKNQQPVALVGKGVTFDSGGISLKPSGKMDEMKYDMCGAASVFGTVEAVAKLDLPINVVGVIPATENMPSGTATRPGDIVKSLSGQTVEILNTDAEGRLILCDALTYTKQYNPKVVIDIATLTGACLVALGRHASGLLSNNEDLTNELLQAGKQCDDRCWELPLWDEYQSQIDSPFADIANIGGPEAGTITAGCFLSRFTKDFSWAHLDIAGVAWQGGTQKTASGRPVPLLTQFILNQC